MKDRKSQREIVVEHLKSYGCITSWDAFEMYGITRLSGIIFNLRKQGYDIISTRIETINRFGSSCHYVEYRINNE